MIPCKADINFVLVLGRHEHTLSSVQDHHVRKISCHEWLVASGIINKIEILTSSSLKCTATSDAFKHSPKQPSAAQPVAAVFGREI